MNFKTYGKVKGSLMVFMVFVVTGSSCRGLFCQLLLGGDVLWLLVESAGSSRHASLTRKTRQTQRLGLSATPTIDKVRVRILVCQEQRRQRKRSAVVNRKPQAPASSRCVDEVSTKLKSS